MKLTPYKKLLTMTKEAVDQALATTRAKSAKKQAELEVCKLEEKLATLEKSITEVCSQKDLNFNKIIELQDDFALTERRIKQLNEIIEQMFPE